MSGGPDHHPESDPGGASQPHGGAARVGPRLRLARQARGFSQQQLAGMAGVSRQAVSAVEAGLSDPSLRVALALSRALGMTAEELFGPAAPEPGAARHRRQGRACSLLTLITAVDCPT